MNLYTPIEQLTRVGPQTKARLKRLNIKTIGDLLYHFPHRYEDFSSLIPISQAKLDEKISIQGEILDVKNIRIWKKRMILTQAKIQDNTGSIKAMWFNQPYLLNTFKKGELVCLAGKLTKSKSGIYLSSPAYEKIPNLAEYKSSQLVHTGRLVPVYPETEKLSSRWLRFVIKPLLKELANKIPDPLPEKIIKENNFLPIKKALWQIHFPDSLESAQKSRDRFSFEELFLLELLILKEKAKLNEEKAISVPLDLKLIQNFVKKLPFDLTDSQKKSTWEILKDMEKHRPMNRLLQGDVGSGKTIVAVISALNTAKAGYQTTIMAPTEILAKQHFKTFSGLLKKYGVKVGLLMGKMQKSESKKILNNLLNKKIDILIGTHSLIQEKVKFKNLALVILDEQHRFGIEQRAKLCQQKDFIPHLLSMTATPIPRTLSLTIYGDLDISLIDEMPKGRKKIITKIITQEKRQEVYDFVREEIKKDRQAFVICPRIEIKNSEPLKETMAALQDFDFRTANWNDVKAVKEEYEKLAKQIFPDLKIAMLHGKMPTKEKESVMQKFKNKKTDILVSTSVVEVGIDISNATIMMIEGAEKFGLAQLHQFRGRVGRNDYQSFCFLLTDSSLATTNRRLKALQSLDNGFDLAEKDLEIRGPGDFVGQRQWGIPDLTMASLQDISLVQRTRESAKKILQEDPKFKKYPFLKNKLEEFKTKIHFE